MPDDKNQEIVEYEPIQPEQMEGMTKMAAASTVAKTLSYVTERRFLEHHDDIPNLCKLRLQGVPANTLSAFKWMKVSQVGRFSANSKENCFDAMQIILHACQLPDSQFVFLVVREHGVYHLYIGLSGLAKVKGLKNFIMSNWKGVVTDTCSDGDEVLKRYVGGNKYNKCYSLTGVPTLKAQNDYARGMEQILSSVEGHEDAAYLVTATPVRRERIDTILETCRELQSQTESFRSFSLSENVQQGRNSSFSKAVAHTVTDTISEQVVSREAKRAQTAVWAVAGTVAVAALCYPPLMAALPKMMATASTAAQMVPKIPRLKSMMTALQLGKNAESRLVARGTIPRPVPKKHDKATSDSTTTTSNTGFSESYTKSITQTVTNAHVEAAVEHLKKHVSRLEEGIATGMWEVGCYLLTALDDKAAAAQQIKSVLSGLESIYEPIRVHDISDLLGKGNDINGFLSTAQIYAQYDTAMEGGYSAEPFRHPLGTEYSRLSSIITTKELSCYVNFPMRSLPGISVVDCWPDFSTSPQQFDNAKSLLSLGAIVSDRKTTDVHLSVPLDTFCRHALVAGVNGSGKTNTVLNVIEGFMNEKRPVMVIEPAKTEYVDWAVEYNKTVKDEKDKIKIYIPGCEYYAKGELTPDELRMNPFEVIRLNEKSGYKIISHLDRLKSSLAAAFPTQDILPTVIERLLYKLYIDKKWISEDCDVQETPFQFPTLRDVNLKSMKELMLDLGYAEENTQNISAAVRTRFNSMKFGWKGKMLCNERLTGISWEELFSTPCVINLSYAGDDSDKAFIMAMLLQYLYEYRQEEFEQEGNSYHDNYCRHLVVVEEAHRVMSRCDSPEQPQYRSNQMFSSIFSEVRAYGQGVMVVDQIPSRLIEDAVKNTNIKFIHRVVAADDARILGDSMGLDAERQSIIPKLSIGQAIVAGLNGAEVASAHSADIFLAQIDNRKEVLLKNKQLNG